MVCKKYMYIYFELFGKTAPKSVNNFLGFCSGDFNPNMTYAGTRFHRIFEKRFIAGGDFMSRDGTGSMTVYPEMTTMKAERNKTIRFTEPYLLAMSANSEGRVGCQFFITLDDLPALDDSSHTIIGRLVHGKETINIIEGLEEFRAVKRKNEIKNIVMPLSNGDSLN